MNITVEKTLHKKTWKNRKPLWLQKSCLLYNSCIHQCCATVELVARILEIGIFESYLLCSSCSDGSRGMGGYPKGGQGSQTAVELRSSSNYCAGLNVVTDDTWKCIYVGIHHTEFNRNLLSKGAADSGRKGFIHDGSAVLVCVIHVLDSSSLNWNLMNFKCIFFNVLLCVNLK